MLRFLVILPMAASMMIATAWAQGSANASLSEIGSGASDPDWPFKVTRTLTGDLLWLNKDGDTLIVVQDNRERRAVFTVNEKTKFKADKKAEIAAKKRISADDLAVGQRVTIIFSVDHGEVLALRFLPKASQKKTG